MRNFVQCGDTLDLVAPTGGVVSGRGVLIGGIFAVADVTADAGESFAGAVEGVFDLAAAVHATDQAGSQGDAVYWDDTAKTATMTATGNRLIGTLTEDKISTDAIARVLIPAMVTTEAAAVTPLTENGGAIGGTNDGDLPDLNATAATLTGTLTGTANGAMVDVAAAAGACGGGATPAASDVDTAIATAVATIVSGVNEQNKEMQAQINALIADNVALRAALREVATKTNEVAAK